MVLLTPPHAQRKPGARRLAADDGHEIGRPAHHHTRRLPDDIAHLEAGRRRNAVRRDPIDMETGLDRADDNAKTRWRGSRFEGRIEPKDQIGQPRLERHAITVGGPWQRHANILDAERLELVGHAMAIFDMATPHDGGNERPPAIPDNPGNGFRHGAIPEELRFDKALECRRLRIGRGTCLRVLGEDGPQSRPIFGRSGFRVAHPLARPTRDGGQPLARHKAAHATIDIERQHGDPVHAREVEQGEIEAGVAAPNIGPLDIAEKLGLAKLAPDPAVEDRLRPAREHLEAQHHVGPAGMQRGDRMQLPAMVRHLVMGFAEQDHGVAGEPRRQAGMAGARAGLDPGAGGNAWSGHRRMGKGSTGRASQNDRQNQNDMSHERSCPKPMAPGGRFTVWQSRPIKHHPPALRAIGRAGYDRPEREPEDAMADKQIVTAALAVIGNEILSGRTQDLNIAFLGQNLNDIGVQLREVRVVPDIEVEIVKAVNELRVRFDYVFTTGGIGPTHDDITPESVAVAFGRKAVYHPEAYRRLGDWYAANGREFTQSRKRMTLMPEGAELIDNEVSIAPGFRVENVFVMAGVPKIMQAMFWAARPLLKGAAPVRSRSLITRIPEGVLADGLGQIQQRYPETDIGSYPFYKETGNGVALVVRATDQAQIDAAAAEVAVLIRQLGGEVLDDAAM